jgi:hypothetical protein
MNAGEDNVACLHHLEAFKTMVRYRDETVKVV